MNNEIGIREELANSLGGVLIQTGTETLLEWAVPVIREKLPILMDGLMKKIGELIDSRNKNAKPEIGENSSLSIEEDDNDKDEKSLDNAIQEYVYAVVVKEVIADTIDTVADKIYRDILDIVTDEAVKIIIEKVKEISTDIVVDVMKRDRERTLKAVMLAMAETGMESEQIISIVKSIPKYYEVQEDTEESENDKVEE